MVHDIDLDAAERAVASLISALGLNIEDRHLAETPGRVARMYRDMLTGGPEFTMTAFEVEDGEHPNGPVLVRDIPMVSFCSHHLLPFTGLAHVSYMPNGRLIGLSKLARLVERYAKRPQVQERLTVQIADALMHECGAVGAAVSISARHSCMELRGVRSVGAVTITSAFRGGYDTQAFRSDFFDAIR